MAFFTTNLQKKQSDGGQEEYLELLLNEMERTKTEGNKVIDELRGEIADLRGQMNNQQGSNEDISKYINIAKQDAEEIIRKARQEAEEIRKRTQKDGEYMRILKDNFQILLDNYRQMGEAIAAIQILLSDSAESKEK